MYGVPMIWTGILLVGIKASLAQTISGGGQCTPAGKFTLCQNLWAADAGTGFQNSTVEKIEGRTASWSTQYSWSENPNQVKSYANLISDVAKGVRIADIATVPTSWAWDYTSRSNDTRANIAYDIWTGVPSVALPASSDSSFELMVWLAGMDKVQPLGSVIASNINLAGHTWDLWQGSNKNWGVLSFVSQDGEINRFTVDLNEFLTYLVQNQGFDSTQYIQGIQAGTEPFTGTATLVTSNYSLEINKKETTSSKPNSPPPTQLTQLTGPTHSAQSSGAQRLRPFWF